MLYNKERLIALMDKFDLAGVVAATPENIYYLSGHASWSQNGYRYGGSQVYVVFPRDAGQSPALLIPAATLVMRRWMMSGSRKPTPTGDRANTTFLT